MPVVEKSFIAYDACVTGEWFNDEEQQQLYIWLNHSSTAPPSPGDVVATALIVIINATGTSIELLTLKLNLAILYLFTPQLDTGILPQNRHSFAFLILNAGSPEEPVTSLTFRDVAFVDAGR